LEPGGVKLAEIERQVQAAILSAQIEVPGFLVGGGEEARRLEVYRNAYRLRLIEALAADYPKLCRWLGEEAFAELARGYLAIFPSRERSLRWVGKHLPKFLHSAPPWQERPELYELAQFEWELGLAFDCADAEPLGFEPLLSLPVERWPELRFRLHPSVRLLRLAYPVPQLWKALEAQSSIPSCPKLPNPLTWLIWRKELKVFFRSLPEPERLALEQIQAGCAFAEVCEGLSELKPDAAQYAALILKRWLAGGLIVAAL
jgi:hypothetical protein